MVEGQLMGKLEIPGYEILEKVAEGGMATIWKARQLSLDRIVALKILNPGVIEDPDDIERFREEARAAARFRHPGLVEIFDAGEHNGLVYYVMEYIHGYSVGKKLVNEGAFPEKEAQSIAAEVASIMDALWDRSRVIHCDIKPDNILIDDEGRVRIADLGLARAIEHASRSIDHGHIIGTPNYASTEQAMGVEDLDCRTDIYGLGASLYHILTGLLPFESKDGMEAMDEQITGQIPDPQSLRPEISNGAAWLMEKMLIKDRELRYQSWKEVLRDLDAIRNGRLPSGDFPRQGSSTIDRSPEREHATLSQLSSADSTSKDKTIPLRKEGASESHTPVVPHITRNCWDSVPKITRRRPESIQRAFSMMLFLAIMAAGLYGGTFYALHHSDRGDVSPEPVATEAPREAVIEPEHDADPEPEPFNPEPREAPEPPESPETMEEPQRHQDSEQASVSRIEQKFGWDNPEYVKAMKLLHEADQIFQTFLEQRDQPLLDEVEKKSRKAIELLKSVSDEAPDRVNIDTHIRQSNQLIFNVRQSRVMG